MCHCCRERHVTPWDTRHLEKIALDLDVQGLWHCLFIYCVILALLIFMHLPIVLLLYFVHEAAFMLFYLILSHLSIDNPMLLEMI